MLRSILLPVVLALVVGLAGSAGYAVMHARTSHAAHVIVQDSLAKMHADSIAADSVAALEAAAEDSLRAAQSLADSLGMLDEFATPADSIRAVVAQRGSKGGTTATRASDASASSPVTPSASPPLTDAKLLSARADSTSKSGEPATATRPRDVQAAATLPEDVLPERRLAKIFGAMSARDAAKVLEQMSDSDVRTILSMMGDRQAAAVLSALPAPRAASITKGGAPASGSGTP